MHLLRWKTTLKKNLYPTIICSGCGTCCTIPIVPVTDRDIRRLTKATERNASKLVRFYTPLEIEFDKDAEVWIKFRYGRRAMGLRQRCGKCIFLSDKKRCDVYMSRPITCRTFPYVIDFDDFDNTIFTLNDIVTCKSTKAPDSTLQEILDYTLTEDEEDEAYFKKIRDWNISSQSGGTHEFLAWCGL